MSRIRLKLQAAIAVLLLLLIAVELNFLAREHLGSARLDLTSSARWTLAPATLDSLQRMQRRFEETVRQDGVGLGRALSERERDDLRVRLDLYVSAAPPPEYADYFRETENRVEDLRAQSGDFLRVEVHRLDPERSRLEIERAEQEGLTPIPSLDEKGRTERLWCGLVLRYAERKESAKNALAPFDVEAWFVRHLDSFLETEPALVCVLLEQELRRTPLARPGLEDLQTFGQELRRWIQKQYPEPQRQQEAQQEEQRLSQAHAPEVLAKDLRFLLRGAVTVRALTRLDAYNKLPEDCRLLVVMRPSPTTLGAEGVEQIAAYLRRGGNVLAFVPRYEPSANPQELQQQRFQVRELGELGNYLETLGVRVRPEVAAQRSASLELVLQQQGRTADTLGRRRASSQRWPFVLRLDRPDSAREENGAAVELALLRGLRDALIELRATAERERSAPQAEFQELLGDFAQTLALWGEVWAAEERSAPAIEGEQGLWPAALTQQRLESVRQRLELRREDLAQAEEARGAAELALRDIDAQIANAEGVARTSLSQERETLARDLATRVAEVERLAALVAAGQRLQRAANFVRKGYATWLARFELSGEMQRRDETSRRAFVRALRTALAALEGGAPLAADARDALDQLLSSFDLLYSFDAFRGGARDVVSAIANALPAREDAPRRADREERGLLLRGPRSLVDGIVHAFLPWANPIELDPARLEIRDGAEELGPPPSGKLRATVIARSAAEARFAEEPAPLGSTRYLQSFGIFGGAASLEKAMLLEAMDPAKRSEELEGEQPLLVCLEGEFPSYTGAREARALLDATRRLASPPWIGGPLAFDDDVDAPVFETVGGWKRSAGGTPFGVDDLVTLARARASKSAPRGAESPTEAATAPGRLLVVPNLSFATNYGMNFMYVATEGREVASPLLQRLLEYALYGSDARYRGFDQRTRNARRRLLDFQLEETQGSTEHRAAELWREKLLAAAATSTFFEGEADERTKQSGGLGMQLQSDPLGQALERLLSGDRQSASEDDTSASRQQRGLDGVVLDIEDRIVARAEAQETRYRLIGLFAAPAALLALLLCFSLLGWVRYR